MLLKYDVNKERFHFVTDVAHQKRKAAVVAQEPELKDVEFKNGKLIVKEVQPTLMPSSKKSVDSSAVVRTDSRKRNPNLMRRKYGPRRRGRRCM
jgi:hypothetical protein